MQQKTQIPLVSILIPTFNRPSFFQLALESALAQTYSNIEIIIGDDSTNDETEHLIRTQYLPRYDHITYIRNHPTLGQFHNDLMLLERANGAYVNFLMDDDLFHPEKIEKMMHYFQQDVKNEISLVTSLRQRIDEKGALIDVEENDEEIPAPLIPIFTENMILNGLQFGNMMLETGNNIIGEPTTVLFRKSFLTEPFGVLSERRYNCSIDMASWIHLLSKGKAAYIAESLSYFRYHDGQQIHQKLLEGTEDITHLVITSRNYGFLQDRNQYTLGLRNALHWILTVLRYYNQYSLNTQDSKPRLLHCLRSVQKELQIHSS
ncbi:glycosyltransferase family 2 protein [Bacillus sp. C1]